MATIKEVARFAGVSRGTVDRVLNGRGKVKPETEEKVREVAAMLKYTPSKAGKSLALKKKPMKLGFIMFNSTAGNPFFDDVASGIKQAADELCEYGVTVDVRYSEFDSYENQVQLMEELVSEGAAGIALTPVNHPKVAQKINALHKRGIPVVTVNTDIENSKRLAYVGSDYYSAGKAAGGLVRLIRGVHANIGIVTGSHSVLCHSERIAGFKAALTQTGVGPTISVIEENFDDDILSYKTTKKILAEHPEINTLFLTAAGVNGACRAVVEQRNDGEITIISYDTVPSTLSFLKSEVIAATIGQQPVVQGLLPLNILFDALAMDSPPDQELNFTSAEIIIAETTA